MSTLYLKFELCSDWHIGNGKEAGAYADAMVLKDAHGLPYLPGKGIKGLLKVAFSLCAKNQWFGDNSDALVSHLFGVEEYSGVEAQGMLQISSGRLSDGEQAYFIRHSDAKRYLYRVVQSTAIDHKSGVALKGSLRSMEVVVPLVLEAEVTMNTAHPSYAASGLTEELFSRYLSEAVTMITSLGAKRHRGLGQVMVSVQPNSGE